MEWLEDWSKMWGGEGGTFTLWQIHFYTNKQFQTIQFSSIWPIDRIQPNATTPSQSVLGSDGNEGVLCIPQSFSFIGTSPSACLVLYPFCEEAVGVFYSPSRLRNHLILILDTSFLFENDISVFHVIAGLVFHHQRWVQHLLGIYHWRYPFVETGKHRLVYACLEGDFVILLVSGFQYSKPSALKLNWSVLSTSTQLTVSHLPSSTYKIKKGWVFVIRAICGIRLELNQADWSGRTFPTSV